MAWCCQKDKGGYEIHEALLTKIHLGAPGVPFIAWLLRSSGVSVLSCHPPAARHGQSLKCDLQPPPAAFPSWWQLLHKVPAVHSIGPTAPSTVPKEGLMLKMHRARSARSRQELRMPKHYCCSCAHPLLHHIYHPCHGVQPQGKELQGGSGPRGDVSTTHCSAGKGCPDPSRCRGGDGGCSSSPNWAGGLHPMPTAPSTCTG